MSGIRLIHTEEGDATFRFVFLGLQITRCKVEQSLDECFRLTYNGFRRNKVLTPLKVLRNVHLYAPKRMFFDGGTKARESQVSRPKMHDFAATDASIDLCTHLGQIANQTTKKESLRNVNLNPTGEHECARTIRE